MLDVLVTMPFGEALLDRIRQVSPEVRLTRSDPGAADYSRAEVLYTPAKFVRKPRGAAPGLVVVVREKTILVGEDRSRIERLTRPSAGLVDPPRERG